MCCTYDEYANIPISLFKVTNLQCHKFYKYLLKTNFQLFIIDLKNISTFLKSIGL